ncbi:MAG: glycosyltransferase family 2 protein [Spirochaetota bacterium]
MASEAAKLTVVVPAYNEEERITECVRALKAKASDLQDGGIVLSVFVVDDGSSDRTRSLAENAGADRIVRHKVNQGLGAAIRSGLRAAESAGADIVVKFDADLQHDPEDIPALIAPLLDDEADVVYGNRFDRIEYRMPLVRRTGNRVFTAIMRRLTGWPLRDSQPGIFAVNRDYLRRFHLPGDYNYTQQILLDAYHKGMRFAHVPVRFRERTTGRSFVSLKYPFRVSYQILLVLAGTHPMRVFGSVGLFFLTIAFGVSVVEIVLFFAGRMPEPIVHANAVLGSLTLGLQTFFFGLLGELIVKGRHTR